MKRLSLIIIAVFTLTINAEARKTAGQIIFHDRTIEVIFAIPRNFLSKEPSYEQLQYRIKYTDHNNQKNVLRPNDALEIRFHHKNEEIRMLSRYNPLEMKETFLKLETDGSLKLFTYFVTEKSQKMHTLPEDHIKEEHTFHHEHFFLQKDTEELRRVKHLNFKRDLAQYLDDCPDLAGKIETRDFQRKDLQSIVQYYNMNCR